MDWHNRISHAGGGGGGSRGGGSRGGGGMRTHHTSHQHGRNHNHARNTHTTSAPTGKVSANTYPQNTSRFKKKSSDMLSSGFSLPMAVGLYLLAAASIHHSAATDNTHRSITNTTNIDPSNQNTSEEAQEIPELPETDRCFNQYKTMMDCLEKNGSQCDEFINLMTTCINSA